jgi:hypothetical protein
MCQLALFQLLQAAVVVVLEPAIFERGAVINTKRYASHHKELQLRAVQSGLHVC